MKRLFLFLVLLASSLLAANATVVTGRVTFDYYGYPQSVNSGTVTLNQDGSVVYSASVVNGYDPAVSSYSARYTIDAVESGTYTIVFRGLGSGNVKTYTSQIVVDAAVDTLTHDIEAEDDPAHVFMTVATYVGPYSYNSPTLPGVEVTCSLGDEIQSGQTDQYGSIQFFCDTASLYTLSFHKEGYEDTSFQTKAVEASYWGVSAKRVQVYLLEDLGVQVAVSGKVTMDGEEWDEFLVMPSEQIAIVSSLDKTYTSRIVNGAYSFPEVTVGDARFFVQSTSGYTAVESKNFRVKTPENGQVTITGNAGETFTQDIVIERIGATVTGSVVDTGGNALRNPATVRLEGNDTVYTASTNYSGVFSMDGIPEGAYALEVTSAGMDTATGQVEVDFATLGTGSVDAGKFELNPVATELLFYGTLRYFNNSTYVYDTLKGALVELWDGAEAVLLDSARSDEKGYVELRTKGYLNIYYQVRCTHEAINDYSSNYMVSSNTYDLSGMYLVQRTPDLYAVANAKAEQIDDSAAVRLSWEWPQELIDGYRTTYNITRITINRKQSMAEAYASWRNSIIPDYGELPQTEYVDTAVDKGLTYFYQFEVQYSSPVYGSASTLWNDSIMVTLEDGTVQEPERYVLTLTADPEDAGVLTGAGEYAADTLVTVNATANEGWQFVAWMSESDTLSKEAEYTFTIVSDTALTALFAEAEEPQLEVYTVTLSASPAEAGTLSGAGEFEANTEVTVSATANEGWQFVAWMSESDTLSKEAEYTFTIVSDIALTAMFKAEEEPQPEMYAVTLSASPAEAGTLNGAGEFEANTEVTVNATANEGWQFVAWMSEADTLSKEAEYTFTIVSDIALTALFTEVEEPQPEMYTVTLSANPAEAGTLSGAGEFEANTEVTVSATANEGWQFVAWMSESDTLSKEAEYTFTIVSDTALTALFVEEAGNALLDANEWACYAYDGRILIENAGMAAVYEVFNMEGRLVAKGEGASTLYEVPVAVEGVYVVRFHSADGIGVRKVFVR